MSEFELLSKTEKRNELYFIINGEQIALTEALPDVEVLEFYKPVASQEGVYSTVEGQGGKQSHGTILNDNVCWVDLAVNAENMYYHHLVVEELDCLVFQDEAYYIWSTSYPGRRFPVIPKPFERDRQSDKVAKIRIEFDMYKGYSESRGTTLDSYTYDTELWQIGMGLPNSMDLKYIYTDREFEIYNAGNVSVDPEKLHELSIALSCIGAPLIQNLTTNTQFQYKAVLDKSDVLLLDGVHAYLNDDSCGRFTDWGFLKLKQGTNKIRISGASDITIAFSFRYLYK